jgi:hypothetical protein
MFNFSGEVHFNIESQNRQNRISHIMIFLYIKILQILKFNFKKTRPKCKKYIRNSEPQNLRRYRLKDSETQRHRVLDFRNLVTEVLGSNGVTDFFKEKNLSYAYATLRLCVSATL